MLILECRRQRATNNVGEDVMEVHEYWEMLVIEKPW